MKFYIREKCQNVKYSPDVVWNEFKDLGKADQESYWFVYLNLKNKLIKKEMMFLGQQDSVEVDPRILFRHALLNDASRIILVHNHPFGDSEPSDDDKISHDRLKKCGELLGIKLVDDVIISDGELYTHNENVIYYPDSKEKRTL
jgi:DNA repair protein RadC